MSLSMIFHESVKSLIPVPKPSWVHSESQVNVQSQTSTYVQKTQRKSE